MTTRDPLNLRPAGCSCDTAVKIRALLEGLPEPLCPVHEVEAIEARDAAAARRQAEFDRAVMREAWRDISPPPDPPSFTALNDGAAVRRLLTEAFQTPVTEADPTTPLDAA